MGRIWSIIKSVFFAVKVASIAIAAPVIDLVVSTAQGKPLSLGQLVFAFWRLFVWLFFVLCATTSIGIPPIIAMLFLVDLAIVGVQIVSVSVSLLKESQT